MLIIVIMAAFTMSGCKKDEDEDNPPDLPPTNALLMDLTGFEEQPGVKKSEEGFTNFFQAFFTVAIWDGIAVAPVAFPAMAYAEAFNHDPVYKGENSWEWAYSKTINQIEFSARLVSKRISNEEFTLKFYVTTSQPILILESPVKLDDFLWFEGTVRYDRTEADWTLYDVSSSEAYLSIHWEKDWEEDTWMIKYTIVVTGDPQNGSYIEQGHTDRTDFNAYFTSSYLSNMIYIEWETTTFSGRIKAEYSFGDTEWHCWDENKMDIVCE